MVFKRVWRLDRGGLDRFRLSLYPPSFGFSLPWPPKLLARARGYVSFVTV